LYNRKKNENYESTKESNTFKKNPQQEQDRKIWVSI
jgi:hypothetical protein